MSIRKVSKKTIVLWGSICLIICVGVIIGLSEHLGNAKNKKVGSPAFKVQKNNLVNETHNDNKNSRHGLVSFVLDDGTLNQYKEIYPLFQAKKIPAIWAIPTNYIGDKSGLYASQEQLDEVYNNSNPKWEIASHTVHHNKLNTIDRTAIIDELSKSKEVLSKYKVQSIVYPSYQADERVLGYTERYYNCGFAGSLDDDKKAYPNDSSGANDINNINYADYIKNNRYALKRVTLTFTNGQWDRKASKGNWKKLVDTAYDRDGWLIFCVHAVNKSSKDKLEDLIDYCFEKGIPFGTSSDGLNNIK